MAYLYQKENSIKKIIPKLCSNVNFNTLGIIFAIIVFKLNNKI